MSPDAAQDKKPNPDPAEDNAFFPSSYSLSQFTSPKSDLADADYPDAYQGDRWKILMIGADERYLLMGNGTMFSTGNHPVETLVPMIHMDRAGFDIDIATLSGNPVKMELWALPREDDDVRAIYDKYRDAMKQPKKLSDIVDALGPDSDYAAIFIPGGHGALIGLPFSQDVKKALNWALKEDRHIITLCHGPAALLAAGVDEAPENFPFKGYSINIFPDNMDEKTPDIGYMPGPMPWFIGAPLEKLGVALLNTDITGAVHQDRKLLTGDSPMAANNLGKLAARALIDSYKD